MIPKIQYLQTVSKALEFIEENLVEDISVKDVTDLFEVSHWQAQRVFRSLVGNTIGQYLRERRLTVATNDLRNGQIKVIDVAIKFQFSSQEAFARAFKKMFGITPVEFGESKKVSPKLRSPLNLQHLEFFWKSIEREPKIVVLEASQLIGVPLMIPSPFSGETDFVAGIEEHWLNKFGVLKTVPGRLDDKFYGIAISPSGLMTEPEIEYVASVKISRSDKPVPGKFREYSLPAGLYAKFENIGLADKTSSTIDYIYGIWLPNSQYQRRQGCDFEVFDARYRVGDIASVSNFYIPIKK